MTPKTKLLEWIEDYCLGNLSPSETKEFETELKKNYELRREVEFEKILQSAITEKDIINLRENLQDASKHKQEAAFALLDGFNEILQPSNVLSPEDLLEMYDSLPKAHIHQHELVSVENIHEFYREQFAAGADDAEDDYESTDLLFEADGLEEAVFEKDIMSLRETLGRISASVRENCSVEDIDNFLNGELSEQEVQKFEQELVVNSILRREVHLHQEVEKAVLEPDVMNLRNELSRIVTSETSWSVSEIQIEDYINGSLDGEALSEFMQELNDNSDLRAEVSFRRNVDLSVAESDIHSLRNQLQQVKQDLECTETRSIVPETKITTLNWWRTGVAIAVVVFAISGVISYNMGIGGDSHDNYYSAPQWTPHRTVGLKSDILFQANNLYQTGAYDEAIALYDKAIADEQEKFVYQFYKASALHNLEQYREAIPEYSKVVAHGDNMFVEEAEWYRALCYVKLGDEAAVKRNLTAIINRNGYYAEVAKAIIRKKRFSLQK